MLVTNTLMFFEAVPPELPLCYTDRIKGSPLQMKACTEHFGKLSISLVKVGVSRLRDGEFDQAHVLG
ncbi:hypothetical protein [Sinomicrobium weinanense]|uniref:Uncharacterized protein n=1 Tax=Sinomicrobium weinanense TaxID=2842200 RepID=A0A926JRL9_9FLAO|nr:hypothetical protein [Sinomicrobium weinanense]MBC9796034.1 hypothetical protein [Sinomicrobium weinanense]MBU3123147.1 hypothetical protein [Sinomicrobium weinanense]